MAVALSLPLDGLLVHLVDYNDKFLDAQTSCKLYMLSRLTLRLETCFKFTFPSRNDESSIVRQSRALNHVWNVILVTGRIEDGELFGISVELGSTDFNGFSFGFLFLGFVHNVSKPP